MRKIALFLLLAICPMAWGSCSVANIVITSQGAYSNASPPSVVFSGFGGATATVNFAVSGGVWYVSSVTVTAGGSYTSAPTVTFSGGVPSPPPAYAQGYAVMSSGCGGGGGGGTKRVFSWLL